MTRMRHTERLLEACKLQSVAIDILFAILIEAKGDFYPSKSGKPWEALLIGNAAITAAEGGENAESKMP